MKVQIILFAVILSALCLNEAKLTIFKGKEVDVSKYSFVAMLLGKPLCTGSLVKSDIVLTAGHCVCHKYPLTHAHFLRNQRDQPGGFSLEIKSVKINPDFQSECDQFLVDHQEDTNDYGRDIAYVILDGNALQDKRVKTVKMDTKTNVKLGTIVKIMGFGMDSSISPDASGVFKVGTAATSSCITPHKHNPICIYTFTDQQRTVGHGDSGGPLYHEPSNTLIGVAANFITYTDGAHTAVYTRLTDKAFIDELAAIL